MNSNIKIFSLVGLADTFYKRSILAFENRTFDDLNSTIKDLALIKIENINIDSNLLNPFVFKNTELLSFIGSVNMIDGYSLNRLQSLVQIEFSNNYYRDMIHKNGIEWTRDLNPDLDVNLSNFNEILDKSNRTKNIFIVSKGFSTEIRLTKLFPEQDFCLYRDFPFNQLVIFMEIPDPGDEEKLEIFNSTIYYTCTYLWLTQYFEIFIRMNQK